MVNGLMKCNHMLVMGLGEGCHRGLEVLERNEEALEAELRETH